MYFYIILKNKNLQNLVSLEQIKPFIYLYLFIHFQIFKFLLFPTNIKLLNSLCSIRTTRMIRGRNVRIRMFNS